MSKIDEVFPKPLDAKFLGDNQWNLNEPFEYINPPIEIIVPAGFTTDGASIPRIVWTIIGSPWSGRYARASVVHDYLYQTMQFTRYQTDLIFYQAMGILGVPRWKRSLMHFSVRSVAWLCWNKHAKKKSSK